MKQTLIDVLGIAGAASIVAGFALIYTPSAFVVGGALALVAAILGAKRWA